MVGPGAMQNHTSEAIAMSNSTFRWPARAALAAAGLLGLTACSEATGRGSVLETYVSFLAQDRPQPAPVPMAVTPEPQAEAVAACRETIAARARGHGAIQVEAVEVGAPDLLLTGFTELPVEMRIHYPQGDEVQVRQARITCRLDAQSRVVALTPAAPGRR
jgi:hypothetical protein